MSASKFFAVAAVLAATACGGAASRQAGPAATGPTIAVGNAFIVIVPTPERMPFDPANARLTQASAELTRIAGHPISFEIDAALLPYWGWGYSFENMLTSSIENVARDLDALHRSDPAVFSQGTPHLLKIACRYSAIPSRDRPSIDANGTLTLIWARENADHVLRGEAQVAIVDYVMRARQQRFGDVAGDRVTPADREEYFAYLSARGGYADFTERGRPKLSPEEDYANGAEAHVILRVSELALAVAGQDDDLTRRVRALLVSEGSFMGNNYDVRMGWADRLAPDATRRRATATWARAMTAHLPRLDDRQRMTLARAVFQGRGVCNNEQECIDVPKDFPGFDRFPLGMMALDAWRAAGYPLYPQTGGDIGFVDEVVGPCGRSADGKWSARYGGNRGFYQQSFASDATRHRFADELLRRGDPKLWEQAFAHAELVPSERVVAMLRLLDGHPRELAAALQVSREHLAERLRDDDPLHRDLVRRGALPAQPQHPPTTLNRRQVDAF